MTIHYCIGNPCRICFPDTYTVTPPVCDACGKPAFTRYWLDGPMLCQSCAFPTMTTQDDLFDRYLATLRARHEKGRKEYGDRSMGKPRAELLGEMQQELVDVAGWAFFEWAKLEKAKAVQDEIASLRSALREAVALMDSMRATRTIKEWEPIWAARDAFIERHKEKSDG